MSTADLQNSRPKAGDRLRDQAANLLSAKYGNPKVEARAAGKKVDVIFEYVEFERVNKIFVEAKDYKSPLPRSDIRDIWVDYMGLVEHHHPAVLLIVTRSGVTPDARAYIEEELQFVRHQTIWELENNILGLTDYLRHLSGVFREDSLDQYYVEAHVREATYDQSGDNRALSDDHLNLFEQLRDWLNVKGEKPVAILGGYGAGKTCFAKRIVAHQAALALADPSARRPILIKLGSFSRFSSIEGIFGAMFSSDFPIAGFNFHTFMESNTRGRLLIILDGFDEMKHAMTWADFRSQAMEINRLIGKSSKVLLLGRPSAFLSQEEHVHVLRGLRKVGSLWHRIPDWPEFTEFELQDFTAAERAEFVGKYLSRSDASRFMPNLDSEEIERRARRVNELADLAPDVFAKPVHAKILTDLGADQSFDLDRFEFGVSRWQLYEAFFETLADREAAKPARRKIGGKARLEFIREIAFWLWTSQGGSTSFSAGDIPTDLISSLPGKDFSDSETKAREYITGSFIEKKSGDIFYFGHRSFAEFLVAQRMALRPPRTEDHTVYSSLMQGGVAEFLLDGVRAEVFDAWVPTLSNARGSIRLEYLAEISAAVGGVRKLKNGLARDSVWRNVLEHFGETFEFGPVLEKRLVASIRSADNVYASILIKLLNASFASRKLDLGSIDYDTLTRLATGLMEREFGRIRDDFGLLAGQPALADSKLLFRSAVARSPGSPNIVIYGDKLLEQAEEILKQSGINLSVGDGAKIEGFPELLRLDWSRVYGGVTILNKRKANRTFYSIRSS